MVVSSTGVSSMVTSRRLASAISFPKRMRVVSSGETTARRSRARILASRMRGLTGLVT